MKKKSNKIQIPNVEKGYVKRKADLLLASFTERVVLLNAGAGYGKTQVLAYYVSHCGEQSAWYSLSRTDNELVSFIQNFTKSVGNALGLEEVSFPVSASWQEDLDILVERLVLWLDERVTQLNMILDDFQEIQNPDIYNLLNALIETMKEKIRFFIAAKRSYPDFIKEYIESKTAVCMETEDLKFGQPEIGELLEHTLGTGVPERLAELICFYTEGWPVGVVLVVQQIRRHRKEITPETVKEICEKLEVSDYFMTRVYTMLPFEIQTFLEKTAVLDYMTVPACNAILGNYQSESLLKYLVREKLFVQSLGERSGIYRYHSIFQRFLLLRISKAEQEEALKKAAYYFLKTEDKIQAAEYGCRGNAPEVVQAVIETAGEEILEERLYDTLVRWFEFLRRQNCDLTPKSRFVYGKYLWVTERKDQARKHLTEASRDFYRERRIREYKKTLLFLTASERRCGNLKEAWKYLKQAEQTLQEYQDEQTEAICTERIKYECCFQRVRKAQEKLDGWKASGITFRENTFLSAAEQAFCKEGQDGTEIPYQELEDGFLLQNCMTAELFFAAYQAADFEKASEYARQILQTSEYETLHTAVAWKMLAILSWNRKNYRKAIDQSVIGDRFFYKNQVPLNMFEEKHRYILEEIRSLSQNVRKVRPLLPVKEENPPPAPETGKKVRIQCMKRFCVLLPNGEEVRWRTKKAQELFAYLFHLQGDGVEREDLLALLWPEAGAKSVTALFHTTLYSIRQVFMQESREPLIVYEKKKYSLNMQMVCSDLEELQECIRMSGRKEKRTEDMMRLYQGGYMENMGYLWAYGTAKKLEDEYLLACRNGAAEKMQENREDLAIPFLQRMQEIEPYDEKVVTLLIVCLYRSGKQGEAKRQYDRMVKLYKEDLALDFEITFQELVQK
ncbi:MAG: hypothetical protein HFG80_01720 [Eubacterium sp.]|nr:hypothetical protein [Eubacterium sp.]